MPASGGSSEAEGRTIVLRNIGNLNEDDLRGTYECLDSDKEVIERVFTLIDEDSAVVIFKHATFAERALKLDHGDIIVSRLPTQIFSSVTAVIDSRVTEMFKSRGLWKEYGPRLIDRYQVVICKQRRGSDLEIFGGSLEVEQCKVFLEKIYKEHVPEELGDSGDGKCIRGQEEATRGHATVEGDDHDSSRLSGNSVQREEAHDNHPVLSPGGQADQYMAAHGSHCPGRREHGKMSVAGGCSDNCMATDKSSSNGYHQRSPQGVEMSRDNGESLQPNSSSFGKDPSIRKPRDVYRDTSQYGEKTTARQTYLIASTNVHVYVGDIRRLPVDIIVNTTNQFFENGSGKARAIEEAAGLQLMQEYRDIIKECHAIPIGTTVMTTAGCLPYEGVCHVVRPTSTNHTKKGYLSDLYDAFIDCLKASVGYRSIAIPAFCSDVLDLPTDDECHMMHRAVTDFCRRQDTTSTILDIHMVDTNAEVVKLIQQEFDQSLSGHMPNAKTDVISQRSSDVTSTAMNGARANVGSSGHCSASSNIKSCSAITGHAPVTRGSLSHRYDAYDDRTHISSIDTSLSQGDGARMRQRGTSSTVMGHSSPTMGSQSYGGTTHSFDTSLSHGGGTRPRHGGTSSVMMKHPSVARTFSSDTGNSSQLGRSPLRRCVSSQPSRRQVRDITGEEDTHDDNKECPICLGPFVRPMMLPTCKHVFYESCIKSSFQVKQTCPICRKGYGIICGTQPANATMTVTHEAWSLPGYYSCGTIVIHYHIPGGIQTAEHPHPGQPYKGAQRLGLLPDNREGKKVLKLLQRAFGQRLTFTVGRSITTGQDNCVTWNDIHHKTRSDGGPTKFGYPDDNYLDRVTQDLAAKGIK